MVSPRLMCRQHLLGEHLEIHMFIGSLKRGISMDGFAKNNMIEPESLWARHDELVNEMIKRGYKHDSPLEEDLRILNYLSPEIRAQRICVR